MASRFGTIEEAKRLWLLAGLALVAIGVPARLTNGLPAGEPLLALGYAMPTVGLLLIGFIDLRSGQRAARRAGALESKPGYSL